MTAHEKLLDRLRKLLALSHSTNPHEAAAASARAAELMAAHRIEEAALELDESAQPREPIGEQVLDQARQSVVWKGTLASGIAYSVGCRMYWQPKREGNVRTVHTILLGRASDVDTARYLYAYLCREVDRMADTAWSERHSHARALESARSFKNAFRVGAANTISRRLRQTRDDVLERARRQAEVAGDDGATRALTRIADDDREVDLALSRLRLRTRRRVALSHAGGFSAGQAAGAEVDLGSERSQLGRPIARLRGRARG